MCDDCRKAAGLPPLTPAKSAEPVKPAASGPSSFLEITDTPLPELPPVASEHEEPESQPFATVTTRPTPSAILNAAPPPSSDAGWDMHACMVCGKLHGNTGDYCSDCARKFQRDPMAWDRDKRRRAKESGDVGFRVFIGVVAAFLVIGLPVILIVHAQEVAQMRRDQLRQARYRIYLEQILAPAAAPAGDSDNDPSSATMTTSASDPGGSPLPDAGSGDNPNDGQLSSQSMAPQETPDQKASAERYGTAMVDVMETDGKCMEEYDRKASKDAVLLPVLADVAISHIKLDKAVLTASYSSMSPTDQQMAHMMEGVGFGDGTPEGACDQEVEKWREIKAGTWVPPTAPPDLGKLLRHPLF